MVLYGLLMSNAKVPSSTLGWAINNSVFAPVFLYYVYVLDLKEAGSFDVGYPKEVHAKQPTPTIKSFSD